MTLYEVRDADPIIKDHAMHWLTCIESYRTIKRPLIGSWWLAYQDVETCVYKANPCNKVIVAFRGTKAAKDLYDDFLLSYGMVFPRADEAVDFITKLMTMNPGVVIELTGHSLGGAIAREAGKRLSLKVITFNAAAPPSRPVVSQLSIDYHIVFDFISAWQSPGTVRIDKGYWPIQPFNGLMFPWWIRHLFDGIIPSHQLQNFSNEKRGIRVSAAIEDDYMKKWFASLPFQGRRLVLVALLGFMGYYAHSLPGLID